MSILTTVLVGLGRQGSTIRYKIWWLRAMPLRLLARKKPTVGSSSTKNDKGDIIKDRRLTRLDSTILISGAKSAITKRSGSWSTYREPDLAFVKPPHGGTTESLFLLEYSGGKHALVLAGLRYPRVNAIPDLPWVPFTTLMPPGGAIADSIFYGWVCWSA